jgi:hypothetical protein
LRWVVATHGTQPEFPLSRQLLDDFDRENLFGQLAENRGVFETLASSGSLMARHFRY